jgi:hypothetical protein
MKKLFNKVFLAVALMGIVVAAFAANYPSTSGPAYPYANPSYTPLANLGPITVSAPATILFTNSGSTTVGYTASGACTGLTMAAQVSNDGTNFTTTSMYPINATTTGAAVVTTSASGVWRSNVQAMSYFRVNISALTGSCTIGIVGDNKTLVLY